MDTEFRDDRRRGRIIIALGLILAVVAGGAAFYLVNQANQQAGQAELHKVSLVVAAREIPARQAIVAEDVAIREVPLDPTNENGIVTDVNQVIGRIPAVTIFANQPVTQNLLASSQAGDEFSILGPNESIGPDSEAWRAISITVADDLAVAGVIKAGQTVDVFVTTVVTVPPDIAAGGVQVMCRSGIVAESQLPPTRLNFCMRRPVSVSAT